ncbi:Uma2 family endonuclease [Nocardiopsis sp. FR26]|uniref:Uma2 family endonuclease n=1 Tax=Nocardiopsis sp. FR26 TaxID=2605987 RepID=UPI001F3217DC|nr:Uma2 family endonuclease [Nocardiopsis sp. FR26]
MAPATDTSGSGPHRSSDGEIAGGAGVDPNGDRSHHRVPDLAVFDRGPPAQGYFNVPPLLAVEVVSPEGVLRDDHTERLEYAAFGVPSCWITSPLPDKVGIIELRLEDCQYREVVRVHGEDVETGLPFPVTLVPHWLTANGQWKDRIGG